MGTTGAHTHPPQEPEGHPGLETMRAGAPAGKPPRGEYAGPPVPAPQNGHAPKDAWIVVGPRTRAHLARVLEQSPLSNAVLVALLETSGVAEGQGFRLVLDGCHLEPEPAGKG